MHVRIVEICATIAGMSAPTVCPFARVAMNVKIAEVISVQDVRNIVPSAQILVKTVELVNIV